MRRGDSLTSSSQGDIPSINYSFMFIIALRKRKDHFFLLAINLRSFSPSRLYWPGPGTLDSSRSGDLWLLPILGKKECTWSLYISRHSILCNFQVRDFCYWRQSYFSSHFRCWFTCTFIRESALENNQLVQDSSPQIFSFCCWLWESKKLVRFEVH